MTATQKRVTVPSAVGENRRRIQILEAIAAGSGEGIQFNSGTYGPDNVGDWLAVETTATGGPTFTEPNGADGDEVNYSVAVNAKNGMLITSDPDQGVYQLTLEMINTTAGGASGLETIVSAQGGGSNVATGQDLSVDSDSTGSAWGIFGFVSKSAGGNPVKGIQMGTTGTSGDAIGFDVTSRTTAGGTSVGVRSRARATGGGTPFCYEGYDDAGALIFQIDDSGNIHIPVAATVINDL